MLKITTFTNFPMWWNIWRLGRMPSIKMSKILRRNLPKMGLITTLGPRIFRCAMRQNVQILSGIGLWNCSGFRLRNQDLMKKS